MVLTDLYRVTQPVIRCRLGDLLEFDPTPCPCGSCFRRIKVIHGRCDDVFHLTGEDGGLRHFFPDDLRRAINQASAEIVEYQAIQHAPDEIEIRLILPADADRAAIERTVLDNLRWRADAVGGCLGRIAFTNTPPERNPGWQKLIRVVRKFWMQPGTLDRLDDASLNLFGAVAEAVYEDDPVWARGSKLVFSRRWAAQSENPDALFRPLGALENDRPLARAVAILTPGAEDAAGPAGGHVGFLDCVADRPDAGRRVPERCKRILAEAGARTLRAPKGDNLLFGCQTAGFDLPQLCLTPHNPPCYRALFEAAGFTAARHIHAFTFTGDSLTPVRFGGAGVTLPRITTRAFDRIRLDREIARFHRFQAAVFADRRGYAPRTPAQDRALIEAQLPFIDDDLVIFAEDAGGEAVGLLVCLPGFYQALDGQQTDRVRIVSIGVLPVRIRQGIGTAMGLHLMTPARQDPIPVRGDLARRIRQRSAATAGRPGPRPSRSPGRAGREEAWMRRCAQGPVRLAVSSRSAVSPGSPAGFPAGRDAPRTEADWRSDDHRTKPKP